MITAARRKRAEVAGSVGAGVLGLGLGVVLAATLQAVAPLLLVAGMELHVWGMWTVHRIDRGSVAGDAAWVRVLYGLCWVLLAALAVYLRR